MASREQWGWLKAAYEWEGAVRRYAVSKLQAERYGLRSNGSRPGRCYNC